MEKIIVTHSDTVDTKIMQDIIKLCSEFPELENYTVVDWENNVKSMLYKFIKTDAFLEKNGGFILFYDNDELVCMSGYSRSDFDNNVFICGIRTLTKTSHRHKLIMSNYIIPEQTKAVLKLNGKMMMYCFYQDKSVYNIIKKNKFNLFLKNNGSKFQNDDLIYRGLTSYDDLVEVNYTVQNVLYKMLDDKYEFDWNLIRVKNV